MLDADCSTSLIATSAAAAAGPPPKQPAPVGYDQPVKPWIEQARLARLKAVNYYPVRHGWALMWTQWDPHAIDADFGRIQALHADGVRVILQVPAFGYPLPHPEMLKRLAQIVAIAHRHRLSVELTLFDWWSQYGDLSGSKRWTCAVVGPYAGDRRIAFIELQNETDATEPGALAWVKAMVPFLRSIDGGIPVALSAYKLAALQALAGSAHPDLFSFHIIAGAERSYTTMRQAERMIAPTPLYIGEEGFSTQARWVDQQGCTTGGCIEALQDHEFRTIARAAQLLGLPPVAPWTLNDFAPGTLTWDPPSGEYAYGLYHTDGKPKKVVRSLQAYFGSGTVSTAFNQGFEAAVGGLPAEWRIFHGQQAQFARDTTVAHSGHASARISHSTSDSTGGPSFFISPIASDIIPGHTYTATVWARGRNAAGETRLALAWFDTSDRYLGQIQSPVLAHGTTSWTHLVASGAAPPGAAYVQIHCKSLNNTGVAWFDDVTFG
jgi:hypothetical protein